MAKNNTINNVIQDLTIDPGASGDSYVQFDINGTGEFRVGVDDGASDAFKISQGSALGTNDTFVVTAAGEITKPLQPAFLAVIATTVTNVSGDATVYVVVYDTEVFDQNGDFDGTSTFTAPVTGRYALVVGATVSDLTSSHSAGYCFITTSNRSYINSQYNVAALRGASSRASFSFSVIGDMDAADTATTSIQINSGTKVVDMYSNGSTDPFCWFSGYLMC